jgi:SulP family sulfate permease
MAGLAALLLVVAWNMSDLKHVGHILRVAPRSDALVLVTCYGLTVAFDMVVAVSVGVVLAALLFMRRMAAITRVKLTGHEEGAHDAAALAAGLDKSLRGKVAVYEIAGPLFFGAAQKAMSRLGAITGRLEVLIIRLDAVPVMDATGLVALESSIATLTKAGCVAVLTGLQQQPAALLERAGFKHRPWKLLLRPDFASGLEAARDLVEKHTIPSAAAGGAPQETEVDLSPRPPDTGDVVS